MFPADVLPLLICTDRPKPSEAWLIHCPVISYRKADWVPVGYPLSNTTVHLLDQSMKPVPRGEYGEVYISGPSVGKEYLNNPVQTEKFFIHHQGEGDTTVKTIQNRRYWPGYPMETYWLK